MRSNLFFLIILSFNLSSCAGNKIPAIDPELQFSDSKHAVIQMSDDKKYKITLYSDQFPLPMNKIHSWTTKIEYANGEPVEKAKIYIHGGMPEHQHDFPTRARIKKYLGDGLYKIEGVKFSMPGNWEMRINVKEKTRRDRAVFKIKV